MGIGPELKHIDTRAIEGVASGFRPRIGVLLSTYNGERYLKEQINSIAAQEGVEVALIVRDDGSTDKTCETLEALSEKSLGCISSWSIEIGENVGFLVSFETLLMNAAGCDYYAFSDQDDFWFPEKLIRAVKALRSTSADLYASSVEIADESLNPIGCNDFPNLEYTIPAELIRHRLAGHNMVWTESLQCRLLNFGAIPCQCHDQHVVLACLLSGKNMIFDKASYALHRRLQSSVTPGGTGLTKRIRHELRMLWNSGHASDRATLAETILSLPGAELSDADRIFLAKCAKRKRFALASDVSFDCGLAIGNVEARISVLLGRF